MPRWMAWLINCIRRLGPALRELGKALLCPTCNGPLNEVGYCHKCGKYANWPKRGQ